MDREQIKFLMKPVSECKDCGNVFTGWGGGNGRCVECDKYGERCADLLPTLAQENTQR